MSAFPEFRRAVVQWRTVAIRRLPQHSFEWARIGGLPEWRQDSDGAYRVEREPLTWDSRQAEELTLLPQWHRIEEIVSNNSNLRAHFGPSVGSPYVRSDINLTNTLFYMLPRPVWSGDRS